MVVNNKNSSNKSAGGNGPKLPVPVVVGGSVLAILLCLFMYHTFVSPLYGTGPKKVEHVAPPEGYPDVPPYNTKEWQQNAKPGQRMPGVPPIDYSKQSGPAR